MSRYTFLLLCLLLTPTWVYGEEDLKTRDQASILIYDIGIELDPDSHSFQAKTSMEVVADGVDEISFAFNEEFVIKRITLNDKEITFARRGKELIVPFKDRDKGASSKIEVEYNGVAKSKVGGLQWSYIGDVTYMIYESLWYPTIHGVRAPSRLEITVPVEYAVISSGELASATERADKIVYVWEDITPAYGISFAAGKYRIKALDFAAKGHATASSKEPIAVGYKSVESGPHGQGGQLIRIKCYLLEKDFYLADNCLRLSKGMLEFYVSKFDGYPYSSFSVVEMPEEFFGGHGDQGFILLQSNVLRAGSEEFIAHEIAHNWWGALVSADGGYNLLPFIGARLQSPRESTKNNWLNEGFATYSAMMFLNDKYGKDRMLQSLKETRKEYLQVDRDIPIIEAEEDYGSTDYHAIVYGKSAFVLHMLRYIVGEEAFGRIIDTYIDRFKGKSTTTEEFEKLSGEIYGDLSWFFDSWIRTTSIPDYAVGRVFVDRCKGKYCINIEVLQKGDVVKMPIDVSIKTGAGSETKRVWAAGKSVHVGFISSSAPEAIELDPDYWILERNRSNNIKVLDYFSLTGLGALVDSFFYRFD